MPRLYIVASIMLLLACNARPAEKNEYAQSITIHNAMTKKAVELEQAVHRMLADSTTRHQTDSLQAILSDLQEWEHQLVEVPGNENHDHASHNHAHHDEPVAVTPEQMLQVQQSFADALERINQRLVKLNPKK